MIRPQLTTGQMLQHFRLECLLGEGGMGVVYRAYDTKLCRPVAVKVLPSELTSEPERKQRFLQEARAAARMSHPAVAHIFYVDEQDGVAFIAMELVEGKTVRQMIEGQTLDLLGAIDIAVQVADGLAKAHELGIVHRDIKPANIMVTGEGHVKILDFGLAKLLHRGLIQDPGSPGALLSTQAGMVMGTAAYMSPEQVRGQEVDARADLFSLGVLTFEMATGQSPFQRANFLDSLHAVAFDETPALQSVRAHLPDELQRIVSRCLQKRPEDRYPDARLLAQDLRRLRLDLEAGLTRRTSWQLRMIEAWERLRRLPPSQFVWFGALSAILGTALYLSFSKIGTGGVVFLALAGLFLFRRIRNRPQKVQDLFLRQVARIPEVRLIVAHQRQFTVVVERPLAQLYTRINDRLRICNQKLYWGEPMTVSILHDASDEDTRRLLTGPGVQYVRDDVTAALAGGERSSRET